MIKIKEYLEKQGRRFNDSIKKTKGRFGELAFEQEMGLRGQKVTRTGVGSDYKDSKGHLHEVKMDGGQLTPRQQAEQERVGNKRYHVHHYGRR